tara:strand:+ start:25361 stop:26971 length:1611 start_codon:yes stop_codon:yes gene_type:complete
MLFLGQEYAAPMKLTIRVEKQVLYDAELIAKIDELGVHPFILLRRRTTAEPSEQFVISPTQNDIPTFAAELKSLPEFEELWLLRGLAHALEGQLTLATSAFAKWLIGVGSPANVKVFVGLPPAVEQELFWGYPALEFSCPAVPEEPRCDRQSVLQSLLRAYAEASGNDAARGFLTDSIALALSLAAQNGDATELEDVLAGYAEQSTATTYARIAMDTYSAKQAKLSVDRVPIFWMRNAESFSVELRSLPQNASLFLTTEDGSSNSSADMIAKVAELSGDDYRQSAKFFNAAVDEISRTFHISSFWGDRLLTLDKAAGFLEEGRFAAAFDAFPKDHPYDQYMGSGSIAWRLHTLVWGARLGLAIEGDFVECGTFRGDMAAFIYACCEMESTTKVFHLFDSFDGFSPTLSSEEDYPDNPGFLEYTNQFYKKEGLYESVVARFAHHSNVKVIKGFLPEALDKATPDKIGFLHVDLNSWQAETACLDVLYDRVSSGGIIIYDDYGWKLFHKQKEAADAFMASRNNFILELPTGQGLVIKR